MKICVIGTGYIGLVGAAIFADWGNEVIGVDIDEAKINKIKAGDMPIYEPGLSEIVTKNISDKRLDFTTNLSHGLKDAEIVFICVGTPQDDEGKADLSYVWGVAKEIGKNLTDYKVIVTKSTVPVGTNEKVKQIVKDNLKDPHTEFDVASNPEFLREGYSVEDMRNTDRTVIGSDSKKALNVLRKLYAHLDSPIVECDLRSAEMIKYASNAFLATKISFMNEIAQLCEKSGADALTVSKGMGLDSRIGHRFLFPGIGYGGSCFPKDVSALYKSSFEHSYDFKILRAVMETNELQKELFIKKITQVYGPQLSGKTLACLGLSFKENTDDIRESVSIKVVQRLRGLGASLRVFDFEAMENAKKVLGTENIYYAKDEYDALKGADALCILTEWAAFGNMDLNKVAQHLNEKVVFDGRNMYSPNAMDEAKFSYYPVGRQVVNAIDKQKN